MTAALGTLGWVVAVLVAAALAAIVIRCRRRLELVARAEHELRGPVTALALAIEALGGGAPGGMRALVPGGGDPGAPFDPPAGERRLGMLEHHLDRLRLGLADLAAARCGHTAPSRPERVELRAVAREAAAGWAPVAARDGRPLRLDWRAGAGVARLDRARLSQALGNLLSNAIEHGEGPLELRGRAVGDRVRLEVRNDARRRRAIERQRTRERRRAGDGEDRTRGRGLSVAAEAVAPAGGRLEPPGEQGAAVAALELPLDPGA